MESAVERSLEVMPLVLAGDMQGAMQALHRGAEPKPAPVGKE